MDFFLAYKEIGKIVRRRRKQLGLTQEVLAPRLNMSRASLANIEAGRQRLLVHQIYVIAQALDMDTKDLLPAIGVESKKVADIGKVNWTNADLSEEQQNQLINLIGEDFESEQGK